MRLPKRVKLDFSFYDSNAIQLLAYDRNRKVKSLET